MIHRLSSNNKVTFIQIVHIDKSNYSIKYVQCNYVEMNNC